jgi:hypothetical protein
VFGFVLTRQEMRVLIFVIAAFLLGLGAKHYRAAHPAPVAVEKAGKAKSSKHESPTPKSD